MYLVIRISLFVAPHRNMFLCNIIWRGKATLRWQRSARDTRDPPSLYMTPAAIARPRRHCTARSAPHSSPGSMKMARWSWKAACNATLACCASMRGWSIARPGGSGLPFAPMVPPRRMVAATPRSTKPRRRSPRASQPSASRRWLLRALPPARLMPAPARYRSPAGRRARRGRPPRPAPAADRSQAFRCRARGRSHRRGDIKSHARGR